MSISSMSISSMPLNFAGRQIHVFGGPYLERPAGMIGVKLAKEITAPCDIDLPISDFSVPNPVEAHVTLLATIECLSKGDKVYVGCMGGLGRTGLFMAILAKASGISEPVKHVRRHYNSHAVETAEQCRYVAEFSVTSLIAAYGAASAARQQMLTTMSVARSTNRPGFD